MDVELKILLWTREKTNPSQSPKIKIGQKLQNSVGVRYAITGKNTAECIGYVGKKIQ